MGWYRRVYFLCILLFLTACASQVELPEDFWQGSPGAVGIVFVRPPTMDTHRGGRKSLLDAAIEEAVTDVVETHLASLSFVTLKSPAPKSRSISRPGEPRPSLSLNTMKRVMNTCYSVSNVPIGVSNTTCLS